MTSSLSPGPSATQPRPHHPDPPHRGHCRLRDAAEDSRAHTAAAGPAAGRDRPFVDPATADDVRSAAEHERLRRDLAALEDQFAATSEVLAALGRSGADPDAVLTTIVQSASRLCRS